MAKKLPRAAQPKLAVIETPGAERPARSSAPLLNVFAGILIAAHAIGHAKAGIDATAFPVSGPELVGVTFLWLVATAAFFQTALGLWGARWQFGHWRALLGIGVVTSVPLLLITHSEGFGTALAIDAIVIASVMLWQPRMPEEKAKSKLRLWVRRFGLAIGQVAMIYMACVIVLRPFMTRWGATQQEMDTRLPLEQDVATRGTVADHVVTVNAPPEKVWPWIVQIGQNKAGFYSYDWLERAVGDHIFNVYQIVPAFQNVKTGDLVRAVQPDYFGGRLGTDVGWKVQRVRPNQDFFLDGWHFWLRPKDGETRFGVRSISGNVNIWAGPIQAFVFEPAHFIMERKMMVTIKELAEGTTKK